MKQLASFAGLGMLFGLLAASGCQTSRIASHGRGSCVGYEPICFVGNSVCSVDERGCKTCTCTESRNLGPDERQNTKPIDMTSMLVTTHNKR